MGDQSVPDGTAATTATSPPLEPTPAVAEAGANEASFLDRLERSAERLSTRLALWKMSAPRIVGVMRIIYLPLALALVCYIGYDAYQDVDLSTIRIWPLFAAYGCALVWWLALGSGWSTLISERLQLPAITAWCKTQVARYLPGGIWAPVARATTVPGRVRDKAAAVAAENVIVLCAAVGIGALWATVHNPVWLPLVVIAALPILGGRWLERRTKVSHKAVVRTTGIYAAGYVAYGLSGLFTQVAVSGVRSPTYPLYVAGAACIAWAVGLVVVFAPGGVGVREVVYVWLLDGLYPHAQLQAAAISARLVTVLAELTILVAVSIPAWRANRTAVT